MVIGTRGNGCFLGSGGGGGILVDIISHLLSV